MSRRENSEDKDRTLRSFIDITKGGALTDVLEVSFLIFQQFCLENQIPLYELVNSSKILRTIASTKNNVPPRILCENG